MYSTAAILIARNEARCVARALRSIRPWVDHVVLLDTGSTDDTVAIARSEGAVVSSFTWINDFSAARNAALSLSPTDWHIVIDADEMLAHGGEHLQALRGQAPNFIGRVEQLNAFEQSDQQGASSRTHFASSWLPRILPAGVRYEGKVHEQPVSDLPRIDLAIQIAHDGYLPHQMDLKGDRNLRLLESALEMTPNDPYLRYQLGKEHDVAERFGEACHHYVKALQLVPLCEARQWPWRHDLILRALFALKSTGQVRAAIDLANVEMPLWHDSPDFHFVLADLLLEFATMHPDKGPTLIPLMKKTWLKCLQIGERPDLEGAVHGRGSYLAQYNLDRLSDLFPERMVDG